MDATPYLLVQLSDPHITRPGRLVCGRVDTAAALRHAVARVLQIRPRPVAVLISGDLVDAGHAAEYTQLRELLTPLLDAGLPLALLPGNHDARGPLQAAFAGLPGVHCGQPGAAAIQYALDLPGPLRLVVLDSLVSGRPHGGFDDARLDEARALLAERPSMPTVVALHHPPHATGLAAMDAMALQQGLEGFEALIAEHPQVQRVVCGHLHRMTLGRVAHASVVSAPSTAHQLALELAPDAPLAAALETPGWLVHAWGPGLELVTHLAQAGNPEVIPDI
ncbi:metallophosphoesterase [Roseateles saccharophilus]|uniref:3',5'-cyclic AMP phosphodiesterase CpdA n=1 Tax=Roseateles saccharophilus TaxID=304 RepID=A0A4R3UX79_ROSSA|nr:metallophosphoesterase [Roseateles saccharophilus]MDG0832669.1 phosphodiesterase [Roseateles saccharophilus]TCU95397.1 3',5'-cyclic AMP phosphodiesterase CpdA [Roseateles saccharophilus]